MQVVTLNPEGLDLHAQWLAKAVEEANEPYFDAIVGVRRGGSLTCDAFLRHFPEDAYKTRLDIGLQRPSTKRKERFGASRLKRLPYFILDRLRMAESALLSVRRKTTGIPEAREAEVPECLESILRSNKCPAILVVDDAIDSGDTLSAIVETLRKINPDARIRTAVITETTRHPRIRANYTIYRNRTLIRFPWSNDYKEN